MTRMGSASWLALTALLGGAPAGPSKPAAELQAALAKPVSPGAVALLIDYRDAPEARERWATALHDRRPETRAATARVVNVAGATALLPDLLTALETETETDAARELMRAAVALGGASADRALFAAASRLPGSLVGVLTDLLGRRWANNDRTFVWPPPSSSGPTAEIATPEVDRAGVSRGTQERRESLTRAASAALRDKDAALLDVVLRVARGTGTDIDTGIMRAGFQMDALRIRDATCWHLALTQPQRLPSEVKDEAVVRTPEETDATFACEVLGRILGRPPTEKDWISRLGEEGAKRVPTAPVIIQHLTPAERKALSLARTGAADSLDKHLESSKRVREPLQVRPKQGTGPPADPIRLLDLSGFPRGFVSDLLAVTGCGGTRSGEWGGAEIAYGDDGRPRSVALFPLDALGKCQPAARTLLMTALAPPARVLGQSKNHVVLVRLDKDSLACALQLVETEPEGLLPEETLVGVGGAIKKPKKVRNVAPVYPMSARNARVQGVVILEAVIAISGCVVSLEVVHGVHPALDVAALRAVSEWRYTPTLLNGRPVFVIMTVTVNFRLN